MSIVFGMLIIYLVSFVLIWLFSTLYFKLSRRVKSSLKKNILHSAILAFINLVVTLAVVAFFVGAKYLFTVLAFLIFSASYFLFYRYVWKLQKMDALILALGMAVVLNPAWLMFLGII